MVNAFKEIFERDIDKVRQEISLYSNETNIWRVSQSISNSGGNLCLHLIGNLKTYIGVGLAKVPYTRQRDLEFTRKNVPREVLLQEIVEAKELVTQGLNNLNDLQLNEPYPMLVWEKPTETSFTLIHLAVHLNYHLGQINYHRRLLDIP